MLHDRRISRSEQKGASHVARAPPALRRARRTRFPPRSLPSSLLSSPLRRRLLECLRERSASRAADHRHEPVRRACAQALLAVHRVAARHPPDDRGSATATTSCESARAPRAPLRAGAREGAAREKAERREREVAARAPRRAADECCVLHLFKPSPAHTHTHTHTQAPPPTSTTPSNSPAKDELLPRRTAAHLRETHPPHPRKSPGSHDRGVAQSPLVREAARLRRSCRQPAGTRARAPRHQHACSGVEGGAVVVRRGLALCRYLAVAAPHVGRGF